jgi:hypothetical protein
MSRWSGAFSPLQVFKQIEENDPAVYDIVILALRASATQITLCKK